MDSFNCIIRKRRICNSKWISVWSRWNAFFVNLIVSRKVKHGNLSQVATILLLYFYVVNSCALLSIVQYGIVGELRSILPDQF